MKNLKKLFTALAVTVAVSFSALAANAENIGVLDVAQTWGNYNKAQDYASNLKVQEADLQKKHADAQKKIKAAKSPVAQRNLKTKYERDIQASIKKIQQSNAKLEKQIDTEITNAINSVSKKKNLGIILRKQSVVHGGVDITADVLKILNK